MIKRERKNDQSILSPLAGWWHNDLEYVMAHTSGSTGTPKEIRLMKADMRVSALATCRRFGIDSCSFMVMPLSIDYIAGKMMVVRAEVSGASLEVLTPTRELKGLEDIDRPIDLLPIVPAQVDALLQQPALQRFRNVIVGGAPLSAEQEDAIAQSGISAYATYGMTETCSHVALRRVGVDTEFEAMPGITFDVDDDSCLIINASEYTSRRFFTTDVVSLSDERHFRWLCRRDHVINSGGIKIFPDDAERRLRQYFKGMDFYVTSRPSERWGEEMVMIVADHGQDIDLRTPLEQARRELAHHLIPKDIIRVAEHEYTTTGKLKKIRFT